MRLTRTPRTMPAMTAANRVIGTILVLTALALLLGASLPASAGTHGFVSLRFGVPLAVGPPALYYPPPVYYYPPPPPMVYAPPGPTVAPQQQSCREYRSTAQIDGKTQP